ncbi:MAG: hypothetical protein HQL84_16370 [Magnetococcales bacterium]|nr:hypothetical protein [Magnetococcales bacterium]MBF0151597.1 hypothetical protein [Magnetococcales bacterium]MBF0171812.1 hypothetical protein [Magnetococcales bacterium]MBF0348722.1 hypothetical protein [Magnetococcales bacterium]
MSTTRRTGSTLLALSALASMSLAFLVPTSRAEAFCCATTLVPATSYVYPVTYAYSPVVYTAPVAWTYPTYAYTYSYYTTPVYYSWSNLAVGCVGITC